VKAAYHAYCRSPLGLIEVGGTAREILTVGFVDQEQAQHRSHATVRDGARQIEQYLCGERRAFELPLGLYGTPFQIQVWRQVLEVPYGRTATYQEIADAIGNPRSVRAVGGANGRNPLPLVVPCHRIIGRHGRLVGYGGGLWRKEWLLRHEGALLV
jgi:methylated-DNA-[protein]-cysteine S-methyltransferase